jgi:hypothetical protein
MCVNATLPLPASPVWLAARSCESRRTIGLACRPRRVQARYGRGQEQVNGGSESPARQALAEILLAEVRDGGVRGTRQGLRHIAVANAGLLALTRALSAALMTPPSPPLWPRWPVSEPWPARGQTSPCPVQSTAAAPLAPLGAWGRRRGPGSGSRTRRAKASRAPALRSRRISPFCSPYHRAPPRLKTCSQALSRGASTFSPIFHAATSASLHTIYASVAPACSADQPLAFPVPRPLY